MWPIKHLPQMNSSPLPVARPYTPPNHGEDPGPFSDYYSDSFSPSSATSPIHSALFSCLAHFEHLLQASHPNEEQMERICASFEDMASILSEPEAQSRKSDDHLFPELDVTPEPEPSYSIPSSPPQMHSQMHDSQFSFTSEALSAAATDSYISAVQSYIEGVKDSTEGLRTRLGEVRELNWIQSEIIRDLRKRLQEMKKAQDAKPKRKEIVIRRKERNGFWAAVGEALDQLGEAWLEW